MLPVPTSELLPLTPENPTGPAWRRGAPFREDLAIGRRGTPLLLEGRVLRPDGSAVSGAILDAWHAGPRGCYDLLSRRMAFRGRVVAGEGGAWRIRTVWPGGY